MELPIGSRRNAPFNIIQLTHLFESGTYSDFQIKICPEEEGYLPETLFVHKVILASASRYFDALFRMDMKETRENCICIKEERPDLFKKIIQTIYGQKHQFTDFIDQMIVFQMLKRYQFYMPMNFIYTCLKEMRVPPEKFSEYVQLVDLLLDGLTVDSVDIIAKKILPTSDLDEISDEMLHLLFSSKYFPRSDFHNELEVFNLIHKLVENGRHSDELYQHVKFANLEEQERLHLISSRKIQADIVLKYFESSTRFHLTYNLQKRLRKELKAGQDGINVNGTLMVLVQTPQIGMTTRIGALVVGDGDQTPIHTWFIRKDPLAHGDIVEISSYTVVSTRENNFYICARKWRVL